MSASDRSHCYKSSTQLQFYIKVTDAEYCFLALFTQLYPILTKEEGERCTRNSSPWESDKKEGCMGHALYD